MAHTILRPSLTMLGVRSLVPAVQLYHPPRRNAVRVRVKRGGTWHDITNRVHRGQVRFNNDDPVAVLDLSLLNGVGFPSLAPRVKTSPLNRDEQNNYAPLLDRYNEIMVEAAFSTDGSAPFDFIPVFHGYLGDSIRTEHDAEAGVVVRLRARDLAKRLQDDVFLFPITFREMYASQIIQALLDMRFGPGEIVLRGIGEDDFWVEEVTFEYIDTWQAIQSFCEQSNKDVRYMLNEETGQIQLTYWTPSTAMIPVWRIQASDIIHETLDTSDATMRHRVIVRFYDADGIRHEIIAEDLSRLKPNEPIRACLIPEDQTSAIKDEAAGIRFANAVLNALKTEPATDSLTLPFNPYMRIYDVIEVTNPRIRSEPELYAIEELRFNFTAEDWSTEVIASDSVKVRHDLWLEKEAKLGVNEPARTRLLPPDQVTAQVEDQGSVAVIRVQWTPRTGVSLYLVTWRAQGDFDWHWAQVEGAEYVIDDLPQGAIPWPSATLFPSPTLYPLPAVYEVGVATVSDFGRSSAVHIIDVAMGV